jgi:hypothetical protein
MAARVLPSHGIARKRLAAQGSEVIIEMEGGRLMMSDT